MKNTQKEYDIKFRNKNKLKYERSLRASNRQESYNFINSTTNKLSLSYEIIGNLVLKKEYYLNNSMDSIWMDRMSRISAPYGVEMLIENERAMSEVFLGGPRYYFHELNQGEEQGEGEEGHRSNQKKEYHLPDARSRFPYDRIAHKSSKIITKLFQLNLNRRINAARIIKRSIKYYIKRKLSQFETLLWNQCLQTIQKKYKKRRNLFKENAQILRRQREQIIEGKRLAKLENIRKFKEGIKKIKLVIAFYHLTRRLV